MNLFKRREGIEVELIEDKLFVFDSNSFKFYEFNETTAFIWELLKNSVSEQKITELVFKEFDVKEEVASKDVSEAIKLLREKKLIKIVQD